MKIVLFSNEPVKIAAVRYRVLTFADLLEAEGHQCVVCLPSSPELKERLYTNGPRWTKLLFVLYMALRRLCQLPKVIGADAVFLRGPLMYYGPPVFERMIRLLNPRMIFDIDDAVWEPPAYVDSPFIRFVDFNWTRKMAGMCAHAVVGNRLLAEYVAPLNPNITIVPTCIDLSIHTPKAYADEEATGPVVLGWTGLADNLGYMRIIEPVLQELAMRHDFVLQVSTGRDYHLEGVEVRNLRWEMAHEIDYLRDADIGLMPLEDTPRARGKCAFKALQYMGVGVPCVISPVGMNAEVIEDGVDGFLADSPEAWKEKLERLISDAALRRRMGEAARKTVEARYSHAANYPAFKAAIARVAALRG